MKISEACTGTITCENDAFKFKISISNCKCKKNENQKTNGLVNAHLIFGPSITIKTYKT